MLNVYICLRVWDKPSCLSLLLSHDSFQCEVSFFPFQVISSQRHSRLICLICHPIISLSFFVLLLLIFSSLYYASLLFSSLFFSSLLFPSYTYLHCKASSAVQRERELLRNTTQSVDLMDALVSYKVKLCAHSFLLLLRIYLTLIHFIARVTRTVHTQINK